MCKGTIEAGVVGMAGISHGGGITASSLVLADDQVVLRHHDAPAAPAVCTPKLGVRVDIVTLIRIQAFPRIINDLVATIRLGLRVWMGKAMEDDGTIEGDGLKGPSHVVSLTGGCLIEAEKGYIPVGSGEKDFRSNLIGGIEGKDGAIPFLASLLAKIPKHAQAFR